MQLFTGICLQSRDIRVLCGLYESRFLTAVQIGEIFFAGKREMAKKRIQKLKAAGLVSARTRGFGVSNLIHLTPSGIRFLASHGHLTGYPQLPLSAQLRRVRVQPLTINHELAVADVKAAFSRAVRAQSSLSLREFGTWPRLYEFPSVSVAGRRTFVAPDGFIRIGDTASGELRFFLEVDRSTESTSVLVSRIASYRHFYRSGGFAARVGLPHTEYIRAPFRVLVVCKSAERRDLLARALRSNLPRIRRFVLFATSADVSEHALGPIWRAPADTAPNAPLRSILDR